MKKILFVTLMTGFMQGIGLSQTTLCPYWANVLKHDYNHLIGEPFYGTMCFCEKGHDPRNSLGDCCDAQMMQAQYLVRNDTTRGIYAFEHCKACFEDDALSTPALRLDATSIRNSWPDEHLFYQVSYQEGPHKGALALVWNYERHDSKGPWVGTWRLDRVTQIAPYSNKRPFLPALVFTHGDVTLYFASELFAGYDLSRATLTITNYGDECYEELIIPACP